MKRQIAKLKNQIYYSLTDLTPVFLEIKSKISGNHFTAAIISQRDKIIISKCWKSTDSFGETFNLDADQLYLFDKYDGWDKAFDYLWRLIDGDWLLDKGFKLIFEYETDGRGIFIFEDPLNKELSQ